MKPLNQIAAHYKLNESQLQYFSECIKSKLADTYGINYDEFISSWIQSLNSLDGIRPSFVKSPWRYDCAKLITQMANDRFSFAVGDILPCGKGGNNLIYRDDEFAHKIYTAITKRGSTDVEIVSSNIDFWNNAIVDGKFLMSSDTIDEILTKR